MTEIAGHDLYLLYQVREKMTFPQMVQRMKAISERYPQGRIFVEEKANGKAVMQTLIKINKNLGARIRPVNPGRWGNKEDRARASQIYVEAGNVWFPPESKATWRVEFDKELTKFPNHPTNDQVDA
ncbi:phage terminase large subunit, partial [Oenococcus oeni]|uniref:phage terminase large subunit n=1 Tax=Oenococcus oeni TaxID=1247 RepID=UPI0015D6748A